MPEIGENINYGTVREILITANEIKKTVPGRKKIPGRPL